MIRAATIDDCKSVYGLMRQLSHHSFTMEQFEDCYSYNLENNHVVVYESGNIICGCGVLEIHYSLHFSRKSAEIVNLIVDEKSRNSGIGKELLIALEQIAASSGCVCLEVASGKQREHAHKFYLREAFIFDHYKFTKELR